jgi:AbrB family transcriptional regulator, transcriptional pleiotropic regulator of transition state genes
MGRNHEEKVKRGEEMKMYYSGIIRQIDELGRIVVPIEMRKALGIKNRDEIEISMKDDGIYLRKKTTGCVICDSKENLSEVKNGRYLCVDCLSGTNV